MKKIMLLFVLIFLFPLVNSDVISINSGGNEEIIINPDSYIEGFFSCIPFTCSDLGYECGIWDDDCGGTLNCGTCASGYTCTSGICVADAVTPVDPGTGGGATGVVSPCNLVVTPSEINLDLEIMTNKLQIIHVTNTGETKVNITPSQISFSNAVSLIFNPPSFTLESGETKTLEVTFVALNQPGTSLGIIQIGCKEVLSAVNVRTLLLLFDSNIVVLNKDYIVRQRDDLKTEVTLIPMGDPDRLDVTLNYIIKDYHGKVYLTKSETLLVEKEVNFKRNFDTGILPLGDYIVGLELVYPNGIAPSSAHFKVVEKGPFFRVGSVVFFLIIMMLIILILIVLFFIIPRLKKKEEQTVT